MISAYVREFGCDQGSVNLPHDAHDVSRRQSVEINRCDIAHLVNIASSPQVSDKRVNLSFAKL